MSEKNPPIGLVNIRRKTLKKLIAGSSLTAVIAPSSWIKPVVETVLLPVHAQTSSTSDSDVGSNPPGSPCPRGVDSGCGIDNSRFDLELNTSFTLVGDPSTSIPPGTTVLDLLGIDAINALCIEDLSDPGGETTPPVGECVYLDCVNFISSITQPAGAPFLVYAGPGNESYSVLKPMSSCTFSVTMFGAG